MSTKWWEFKQNNSGGSFEHDPEVGIGFTVWVEARNPDEASARAQDIGLYFDGVRDGVDCGCCGDRWIEPWGDGKEMPTCFADVFPRLGTKPSPVRPVREGEEPHLYFGIPGYVHPLEGYFYAFVVEGTA